MSKKVEPKQTEVVPKATRRTFTAEYKRDILEQIAACKEQGGEIGAILRREGLYSAHISKWRRVGPLALDGLLWLADRYAASHDWWSELSSIAHGGAVTDEERNRIRALAVRVLEQPGFENDSNPLHVLGATGAPESLFERLWALVMSDDDETARLRHDAGTALGTLRGCAELEARLPPALREALADGDDLRAWRLGSIGLAARVPGTVEIIRRALDDLSPAPELWGTLGNLARTLVAEGHLAAEWVEAGLADPSTPRFGVAIHALVWDSAKQPRIRVLLEAALDSDAFEGRFAAEACADLLRAEVLAPTDPLVLAIFRRVPERRRRGLLYWVCGEKSPLAPIEDLLWDMLFSADEDVRTSTLDSLLCAGPAGSEELLRRAYPLLTDSSARAEIEHKLGLETEADTYWQLDEGQDDEVDDDDDEEEYEDEEDFKDMMGL